MLLNVYTVYDAKAEAYLQSFFAVNEAVATRDFSSAANDPKHPFCLHAEDFTLFQIGVWDPWTGSIESIDGNPIAKAIELRKPDAHQ